MKYKRIKLNLICGFEDFMRTHEGISFKACEMLTKIMRKEFLSIGVRMERFARDFLDGKIKLDNIKGIMTIRDASFKVSTLHTGFIEETIGKIIYCLMHGYYPSIEVMDKNEEYNVWNEHFIQPFSAEIKKLGDQAERVDFPCGVYYLQPSYWAVFNSRTLKLWQDLYKRFVVLNDKVEKYVDDEMSTVFVPNRKILGVLCRGTEYTRGGRPSGHPIQPPIEDVIKLVQEKMKEMDIEYIYLATEDGKIANTFKKAFPEKVLENKRFYYDDKYDDLTKGKDVDNPCFLSEIGFERDDDLYWRGVEYLSSLKLVSNCDAYIAGNCGGGRAALYLNSGGFKYWHIFDCGLFRIDD